MSHVVHHAIVVTTWDPARAREARDAAEALGLGCTSIVASEVNDWHTFLIVPDGSGEGWPESDKGDARRDDFVAWLLARRTADGGNYWEWAEVAYGNDMHGVGDDPAARVTRHAWQ